MRLWVKKVHGIENLPQNGPAIIISNHTSYYDWLILSAIYDRKYIVFIANQDLQRRPFINWFVLMNIMVFIDPKKPIGSYFRQVLNHLRSSHIVAMYPEGTRSRTGRMIEPKIGFVKIALKSGAPIIPVAMKGVYDILPPHRHIPQMKQCEVFVEQPFFINDQNPMFKDIFERDINKKGRLSDQGMKEIAFRIMEKISDLAGQSWDKTVVVEKDVFLSKVRPWRQKEVSST